MPRKAKLTPAHIERAHNLVRAALLVVGDLVLGPVGQRLPTIMAAYALLDQAEHAVGDWRESEAAPPIQRPRVVKKAAVAATPVA